MIGSVEFLLLVVVVAGCSSRGDGPSGNGKPGDARAVALHVADVSSDFKLSESRFWTAAQTAGELEVSAADYQQNGGGSSYEQSFVLKIPSADGISFISDRVFPFASSSQAAWGYKKLVAALASSGVNGTEQVHLIANATPTPLPTRLAVLPHPVGRNGTPYQLAKVPKVGAEDAGFTVESVAYAGEYDFENDLVAFREGKFCATVRIAGAYNQVPWSMAIGLARKILLRIDASR